MTTRSEQETIRQLDDAGLGFRPKKPRIAEIVGAHCLIVAAVVGIGFVWSHFVKV